MTGVGTVANTILAEPDRVWTVGEIAAVIGRANGWVRKRARKCAGVSNSTHTIKVGKDGTNKTGLVAQPLPTP